MVPFEYEKERRQNGGHIGSYLGSVLYLSAGLKEELLWWLLVGNKSLQGHGCKTCHYVPLLKHHAEQPIDSPFVQTWQPAKSLSAKLSWKLLEFVMAAEAKNSCAL